MKDKIDKYLVKTLEDFLVYEKHFKDKVQEFNKKVTELEKNGKEKQEISKEVEEDSFEIIVLRDDMMKTASTIEVLVDFYRKTGQEIPKEYKEITSKIDGYEDRSRLEVYTFIVDRGKVVEREKGLLKSKLEITRKSQVYKELKEKF